MKQIKILNKETAKWWGKEPDTTWALKKGNDWWLLHPEVKPQKQKEPRKAKETFSFSKFLVACSLGSFGGLCLFSFIYFLTLLTKIYYAK
jgi:hypothetical protein